MTSPNEDELLAENVEIKRAADTISILLCQVSRQNRDYKAKIDRLKDRLKAMERRNRTLSLRSRLNIAKNKSLKRQNDETAVLLEKVRRGIRDIIREVKAYLLNKKVTLAITVENDTGTMPSRHISPRKRQRKLNLKIRQLAQLKNLLKED